MYRLETEREGGNHAADRYGTHSGCRSLALFRRIVAGSEVNILKDAVACEADKRLVIVDLAGVDAIDARGLGLLVFLQTLGYALGFELELLNPTPRIEELLDLTRLDSVLETSHSDGLGGEISEPAAA